MLVTLAKKRAQDATIARLTRETVLHAGKGPLRVSGLRGSGPALCLARLVEARPRPVLVTLATATEAESFAGERCEVPLQRGQARRDQTPSERSNRFLIAARPASFKRRVPFNVGAPR